MDGKKISVEMITKENSVSYGVLVTTEGIDPDYKDNGFSFTKHLAITNFSEKVSFSLVESYPENNIISILEYHNNTPEVLVPINNDIILVLATGQELPDENSIKAFKLLYGQAFIINSHVWHYAPIVSDIATKTFVIFNENTPDNDVIQVNLNKALGYIIEV